MSINESSVQFEDRKLRRMECTNCGEYVETDYAPALDAFVEAHAHVFEDKRDEFGELFDEQTPPDLYVVENLRGTTVNGEPMGKWVNQTLGVVDLADPTVRRQEFFEAIQPTAPIHVESTSRFIQPGEQPNPHLWGGGGSTAPAPTYEAPTWEQLHSKHVEFYGKTRSIELEIELTTMLANKFAPAYWTVGKLLAVRDDMHKMWTRAIEAGFRDEAQKDDND